LLDLASAGMIMLWGLESDTPLAMVGAPLCARDTPVFLADQDTRLELEDYLIIREEKI
jgi:hypothetical protein